MYSHYSTIPIFEYSKNLSCAGGKGKKSYSPLEKEGKSISNDIIE